MVDVADRVTQTTFGPTGAPDPALTVGYQYGGSAAQFNVGRLIGITRNGAAVAYEYRRYEVPL
jgi:hypothetical protein